MCLLGGDTGGHDPLHLGLTFLEPHPPTRFKESPFPVGLPTTILFMQQVIIPCRRKIPRPVFH
ncbi:hypothetical protein HMPREF0659_A5706 [Prevotella melaninogenica ATCC 25845]|nr:hypothetical protein HMPREF0659_A5706 [Prevotella melaninogenica ATCC 25845]